MKDWRGMAQARGMRIPAKDIDRVAAALDALDEVFAPLAKALTADVEPATEFRAEEDE